MERIIHILDKHTANRIAAGEVVDRPASVVKELVENALDAGSTNISIEADGGGIDMIRVRDNGAGIPSDEIKTAFERHATSKIRSAEDLECIDTLGFRGEALASIAAVARVTVRTKQRDEESGALVKINGGELVENMPAGCPDGTLMQVENLFYNTPARLKFLKSSRTEAAAISDYVSRVMMAYPGVAFKLIQNERTIYQSAGDGDLRAVIGEIYGKDALEHLKAVEYDDAYVALKGYVGTPQIAKNNRMAQSFYINHRYIKSQKLSFAIQRPYDTRLMTGKFPLAVLDILISNREIDVNVHPNKLEVRFRQENRVTHAAHTAVKRALGIGEVPSMLHRDVEIGRKEIWNVPSPGEKRTEQNEAGYSEAVSDKLNNQKQNERASIREAAASYGDIPVITIRRREEAGEEQYPLEKKPLNEELRSEKTGVSGESILIEQPQKKAESEQLYFSDEPYTVIGQLFACYILVQQGEEAFFIDQHAAHERKLYEQMSKKELRSDSQLLLSPQILRLSAEEYLIMQENIDMFNQIGFEIEEFGPLTISIRAVPYVMGAPQTVSYLHEALDLLGKKNRYSSLDMKRDAIIQQACKHAIKAGAKLGETEIRALLNDYQQNGAPLTCPHGRPVMIKVSRTELEKLFKRLV